MFIRTKEGKIFDTNLLAQTNDFEIKIGFLAVYLNVYNKGAIVTVETYEIVKRADTIEELCDEFVYNNQLLCPSYIDPKDTDLIAFRYRIEDEFNYKNHKEIYGAIWTEKGLIYAAKVKGVSQNCEISWELL